MKGNQIEDDKQGFVITKNSPVMPVSARMIRTGPTERFSGKTLPIRELQSEVRVLECFTTWLGRFLLIRWSRVRVPTASLRKSRSRTNLQQLVRGLFLPLQAICADFVQIARGGHHGLEKGLENAGGRAFGRMRG